MVFFPFAIAVLMFCIEDYRGDYASPGRAPARQSNWLSSLSLSYYSFKLSVVLCDPSTRPNNSFKPNPLRGSA